VARTKSVTFVNCGRLFWSMYSEKGNVLSPSVVWENYSCLN
jgi:hypothetical protein